jgi:hypothetical protein
VSASRPSGDSHAPAVCAIGRRLTAYPGVRGLLYRRQQDLVELVIVAPPPMTAPLTLLVATWSEEIRMMCPNCTWRLHVLAAPPSNPEIFRCVFWRPA